MSAVEVRADRLEVLEEPLLGTAARATSAELALARRFDELHQLLYVRGGVRPTNAAIEELGKLILLRLWSGDRSRPAAGGHAVRDLFTDAVPRSRVVEVTKQAFTLAMRERAISTCDLTGQRLPLWPEDEPFRLSEPVVLQAALEIVDEIVGDAGQVTDPMGTAFDAFLNGRYDHAGGLGTYLTPSSIARFMADIALDLLPSDLLHSVGGPVAADPFCGTGRFLVALLDAARERSPETDLEGLLNGGLLGADQSTSAIAKSGLNLLLYGSRRPTIWAVRDSVTDPALDTMAGELAVVLTNPPFGGGKYADREGIARTAALLPSLRGATAIDPALAGLVRCLELLRPGGVLGIVLPEGVVNGRQFESLLLRPELHVAASVNLPTATFALSGTVARTSAVFIRKAPRGRQTILSRIDHVGFIKQAGKAVADPSGSDLPRARMAISAALAAGGGSDEVSVYSEEPLVAAVAADGLTSVDPSRLDPDAVRSRHRLLAHGGARLGDLLTTQKRRRVARSRHVPFVSVLHVDSLGTIDWGQARRYQPTTPGQAASEGDVLISLLNPSKLRAGVVPAGVSSVECSAEFGVFTTHHNPYSILGLLYKPDVQAQLRPLGSGTSSSRRRIAPEDVLDLVVPRMTDDELDVLGRHVERLVIGLETQRVDLDAVHRQNSYPSDGPAGYRDSDAVAAPTEVASPDEQRRQQRHAPSAGQRPQDAAARGDPSGDGGSHVIPHVGIAARGGRETTTVLRAPAGACVRRGGRPDERDALSRRPTDR